MTKAEIVQALYSKVGGFSRKESAELVDLVFEMMKETLGKGEKIKVSIRYEDKGRLVTVPAQSWVKNTRTGKPLDVDWVFAGSGLVDNPPRILPEGCAMLLRRGAWPVPKVFPWLMRLGSVDRAEMDRIFNMGIGLVLVVAEYYAEAIVRHLADDAGTPAWIIGEVVAGDRNVIWDEPV